MRNLSEKSCDNALNAINQYKFEEAVKFLNEAKTYWPENLRIKIIEKQLKEKIETGTNSSENRRQNYNNNNNYNNTNNTSTNSNNTILIVIGVILFIIMILIMSLTMKNLSSNSNSYTQSADRSQNGNTGLPRNDSNTELSQNTSTTMEQPTVDDTHDTKKGYTYLKNNGQSSSFSKRSLGYEEGMIGVDDNSSAYENIKSEYCNAVNEIEKVDKGIVPGTNKPFTQATYTEVDDAYREYLQQIAQIRQVVILAVANEDMENEAGCYYKGTHWNNANSQYRAKQFYNDEIDSYYNTYGN